jgi:hypothetical protein
MVPIKLQKDELSQEVLTVLKNLNSYYHLKDFYLVNDLAFSLFLGHRKVDSISLFTQKEFTPNMLIGLREKVEEISVHNNSIEVMIDGVKVFFFYYGFLRYKRFKNIEGINIAHPIDLGIMKLIDMQMKITKTDIIDLYFLDKDIVELPRVFSVYERLYPNEKIDLKTFLNTTIENKDEKIDMIKEYNFEESYNAVSERILDFIKKKIS